MTPPVPPLGWSWQMKEWLRWKNLDVAILWCWGSLLVTGRVVPHSHYLKQLPQAICTSSVFTCLNQFLHQSSHYQTSCQMFHSRYTNMRLERCIPSTLSCVFHVVEKRVLANCLLPTAPAGSDILICALDEGMHISSTLEPPMTPLGISGEWLNGCTDEWKQLKCTSLNS